VLRGHGDGTFDPPVGYPVGVTPTALVVGDFNGDGIPDVAVINNFSSSVSVLQGNGDGTLQAGVAQLVGIDPRGLVAAHFTRDGSLDLAVANHRSGDVSVLLNQGGGGFAPGAAGRDALLTRSLAEEAAASESQQLMPAVDAVFAANPREAFLTPSAVSVLADASVLFHYRDRADGADTAGLADPFEEVG
jgi:hypothetical protein